MERQARRWCSGTYVRLQPGAVGGCGMAGPVARCGPVMPGEGCSHKHHGPGTECQQKGRVFASARQA